MLSPPDDDNLERFEEALNQRALSASTIVNYLADLRAFHRWGQQTISDSFSFLSTSQEHIRLYRHHLAQVLNRAPSTTNRHLMSLRKFYAFALDTGLMATNPTVGVALVGKDNGQAMSRPLSDRELNRLLEAAKNGSRAGLVKRDTAILQLLLHTGLRVGELVDLQTDDLVFDNPGIHLQVCDHRDRSNIRNLPVSDEVRRALLDYLQMRPKTTATDCFFLNQEGRQISKRTVQRIVSDCAKTAGLSGVSAQSIRRTYALQLFSKTEDITLVSKRLGHQNKAITEQYLSIHEQ